MTEFRSNRGLFCPLSYLYFIALTTLIPFTLVSGAVSKSLQTEEFVPTLYLSQHCRDMVMGFLFDNAYVFLEGQARLMGRPMADIEASSSYIHQEVCIATFAAPPNHQLLLHFQDVAIDNRATYKSRLDIYDGFDAETRLSPYNGLYGETKKPSESFSNIVLKDYISSRQALSLMFKGQLSKRFYGFKAVLTPVRRPLRNGTCPSGLFQCQINGYCIDPSMVCNGIPNCGERDQSDEKQYCAAKAYELSSTNLDDLGLMIGCAVSILILLLAVIWVGVMCHKRQRLRTRRHELRADAASHWQQAADREVPRENSRWLPNMFQVHLPPWLYTGPPPAYSETPPGNEASNNYELPPQYIDEQNERRCLIPHEIHITENERATLEQNINCDRRLIPSCPQLPSYDEANNTNRTAYLLLLQASGASKAQTDVEPPAESEPKTPEFENIGEPQDQSDKVDRTESIDSIDKSTDSPAEGADSHSIDNVSDLQNDV